MRTTPVPKVVSVALFTVMISCVVVSPGTGTGIVQAADSKAAVLALVNGTRLANGLAPLAVNPALETAAQQHSDDMARKGYVDHTGSDGSSAEERISAAGYPAWSSTRVLGELVYAGDKGFSDALNFFLQDDNQRRTLLNSRYREVGIGLASATNASGVTSTYWTLNLGAQPNVLPVFINDGVALINVPQVAVHLTQEDAMPGGEGNTMGRAVEMRVSSDYSFKDVPWRKWEALVPYTFDAAPGLKTVYVQMRDGGGRSAISAASVRYDPNSTPQVAPMGPGGQAVNGSSAGASSDATPTPPARPAVPLAPLSATARHANPVAQVTAVLPAATRGAAAVPATPPPPEPLGSLLADRPNAALPDWLPLYVLAQAAIVVAGAAWFFKTRR